MFLLKLHLIHVKYLHLHHIESADPEQRSEKNPLHFYPNLMM